MNAQSSLQSLRIVVIAASSGGLKALTELMEMVPRPFPAAVIILQHLAPGYDSMLAEILSTHTSLDIQQARAGDRLMANCAYVAPPDYHLLVDTVGHIVLTQSERVQFVRPSADLMFESLAEHFGARAIAVVLTGTGKDGARGVESIKAKGGIVIAQDEATSDYFGMPGAAINTGFVDAVLPLRAIIPYVMDCLSVGNRL